MTFLFNSYEGSLSANTADGGYLNVNVTTARPVVVSNVGVSDGYNDAAVARILKAKKAKTTLAFTDSDKFLDWLNK